MKPPLRRPAPTNHLWIPPPTSAPNLPTRPPHLPPRTLPLPHTLPAHHLPVLAHSTSTSPTAVPLLTPFADRAKDVTLPPQLPGLGAACPTRDPRRGN